MTFEQLQKDMIAAMKAHDKPRKDAISSLVSAVKKLAIDEGSRDNITEDIVGRAIMKEYHAAKDSLDSCPDSRPELKAEYQFRYDVISEYVPKMMSRDEIRAYLTEKHADLLAGKNRGMIMKTVIPELKGKADNKDISAVVGEFC
ncbi:MAG: GatB/YqeY domain-containing protein [Lachnospiraceae bacterium]|jgi:uncharacterized protein YqeY